MIKTIYDTINSYFDLKSIKIILLELIITSKVIFVVELKV